MPCAGWCRGLFEVWGLNILVGLGVILGLVLLVVPGVLLATMWSVAVPVKVIEKRSPDQCLRRSAELTRGRRLPVLGLLTLYIVAVLVVALAISVAVGLILGLLFGGAGSRYVEVIVGGPLNGFAALIWSLMCSALYRRLVSLKEGRPLQSLETVFA